MARRQASPSRRKSPFAPIEEAVQAIRDGKMIIVVDDEDRENEGDLTIAGDAPVDADTVAAIADLVGAQTDEIYSDDAGLAWAAS